MKRKAAIALIIACLFTSLPAENLVQVKGEYPGYKPPIVRILSPSPNAIYNTTDIPLNVTVQIFGFLYHNIEHLHWLKYSLDGQANVSMNLVVPQTFPPGYYVYANDNLSGLTDGTYTLTIYGRAGVEEIEYFSKTITFQVDRTYVPAAESSPTMAIIIMAASVLAVTTCIAFIVYANHKNRAFSLPSTSARQVLIKKQTPQADKQQKPLQPNERTLPHHFSLGAC